MIRRYWRTIKRKFNDCKICITIFFSKVPEPPFQNRVIITHSLISHTSCNKDSAIPQYIWMYWDNEVLPEFIKNCIQNIQFYCPSFKLNVITPQTLNVYIPSFPYYIEFSSIQAKADLIRLAILAKVGGVWLDASCALSDSLQWVLDLQIEHNVEYIGFYNPTFMNSNIPYIENWFMATTPGSDFIQDWYHEYLRAAKSPSLKDYYKSDPAYWQLKQNLPDYFEDYLIMHLAAQKVLLNKRYNLLAIDCTDEGLFYRYATTPIEEPRQYADYLLGKKRPERIAKLIKFTGSDRVAIERFLVSNRPIEGSILKELKVFN